MIAKIGRRFFQITKISLIVSVVLLPILAYAGNTNIEGYRSAFGPSGNLKISSPVISWEVWAGPGCTMTSTEMILDGQKVPAHYDSSTRLLTYIPSSPLTIGSHSIQCRASVEQALKIHQEWNFQIEPGARIALPDLTSEQLGLIQVVNQFRKSEGLPDVTPCQRLAAAAQAHSQYLADAHTCGHFETTSINSFVGETMSDRLNAFGWIDGGYEDVGYESEYDAGHTIASLFEAPYHRTPFLQPGNISVGVGATEHRTTIEFGFGEKDGLVTSPDNGATGIPSAWDGVESPNPLRLYDHRGPVGYPIMIAGFGKSDKIVDGTIYLLNSNSEEVKCFVNTPANDDHLDSQIIAIPKEPLSKGIYKADAKVFLKDGRCQKLHWTFTVGS